MFLEDIPTTKEDYKKKEKEWPGFERVLSKIGLDKEEVLDRIKKDYHLTRTEKITVKRKKGMARIRKSIEQDWLRQRRSLRSNQKGTTTLQEPR